MRASAAAALVCLGALTWTPALAQDWTTGGYDAQRSSWVRAEGKISAASLRKPGFQLVWTLTLADESTATRAVTPPVLLDFLIGYRGFRSLGFVGAPSDHVIAIDTDLGRVEWERRFAATAPPTGGSPTCARDRTPQLARPTNPALGLAGRAGGASRAAQPARGAVGEPGEGAATLAQLGAHRPEAPHKAPAPTQLAGPRPAPHPFAIVYVLPGDGMLHTLNVMNGADAEAPAPFIPSDADAAGGLIVVDDVAYVATARRCGEALDAVWALDLGARHVTTWRAPGGIAGALGPAMGPDGTLYVTTRDGQLVALEPRTLKPKGTYRSGGPAFISSPVVFDHRGGLLIAASSREGRIRLLDSRRAAFVGTPSSAGTLADELAAWADTNDTRWLVAPAGGSVVAWKVVQEDSVPVLRAGWVSRDMPMSRAPTVVNDVIFAVSRGTPPAPADLYALDGATGKELWDSGSAMTTGVPAGMSAGGSQVYVATGAGTLYAFGFPMEH